MYSFVTMATKEYVKPPKFGGEKTYERWISELQAWQVISKVEKKNQALAIALSFDEGSEVRDKVFHEIKINELNVDDGMTKLLEYLDKWYKKDELSGAYEAWGNFDKYKKSEDISIESYILGYQKRCKSLSKHKIEIPKCVLAFKLLDCAGLEHRDKQLVLTAVDYNEPEKLLDQMMHALSKFFGSKGVQASTSVQGNSSSNSSITIKSEPVYVTEEANVVNRYQRGNGRQERSEPRGYNRANFGRQDRTSETRGYNSHNRNTGTQNRKNPVDIRGNVTRCHNCGSVFHYASRCPKRIYEVKTENEEEDGECYLTIDRGSRKLVGESFNYAVLDSACSSTVCGIDWMDCYLETLSVDDMKKVKEEESSMSFKFGDGSRVKSLKKITFPAVLAGEKCRIKTDVVNSDIPLLFGKPSMEKARVKIDFEIDCAEVLGRHIQLKCTPSGHYCIPIYDIEKCNSQMQQVLVTEGVDRDINYSMKEITKLHKQFGHPSSKRLIQLLKSGGMTNVDYFKLVEEVTDDCNTCTKYKRTPSKPVVSLPLAKEFNETVAMDLKEWNKGQVYFLHVIDVATRFSRSAVIYSKEKRVIIDKVIEMWMGTGLGAPEKILCDNGGEFANSEFLDMCENLNIRVMHTAAESPFSNGICERNHAVVDDSVRKIKADQPDCPLPVALAWAVHAKNCLMMVSGYSPYQLVFGRNPRLPCVINDSLPALEGTTISETFASHLNAMHAARKAFIQAETSEKIRRALRHQVRPSGRNHDQGELVYFKRDDDKEWKGPGTVIGQDGKVVILRNGSSVVRVHSSRVTEVSQVQNMGKEKGREEILNTVREYFANFNRIANDSTVSDEDESEWPSAETESDNTNTNNALVNTDGLRSHNLGAIRHTDSIPKVGQRIKYLPENTNQWKEATILSRAGKATGQNRNWLNIKDHDGEEKSMDFGTGIQQWQNLQENDPQKENSLIKENEVFIAVTKQNSEVVSSAKQSELNNWKQFGVYEEVQNRGQTALSVRWVCTEKTVNNETKIKARLVARGFEETQSIRADSPTGSKDTLRIFMSIMASKGWRCKSIDIKAAFLQGNKIEREVFLVPPKEAECPKGTLWKLKKCVYGLNDAARSWYFTVRTFLVKLGCTQLKTDPASFYWYNDGELSGVFIMHVDDYFYGGTQAFENLVVANVKKEFQVGQQADGAFKYIGLEVSQNKEGITLSQNEYLKSVQPIPLSAGRASQKNEDCNSGEMKSLRSMVGQIGWLSAHTRPDMSYEVLELSCNMSSPKVENLVQANKCVKKMGMVECNMKFPDLGDLKKVELVALSDASHANLPDGFSSAGGFIVFLIGENGNSCPLAWEAKKIRRVVKSTLAAETLAASDAVDTCYYLGSMLSEILFNVHDKNVIPITCYVDNYSLFENAHSTKNVTEKRLRIDLAALKELVKEGQVTLKWLESCRQLSDCFTKRGVSTYKLIDVIERGKLEV